MNDEASALVVAVFVFIMVITVGYFISKHHYINIYLKSHDILECKDFIK